MDLDKLSVAPVIDDMVDKVQTLVRDHPDKFAMVGILTGGAWVAAEICRRLNFEMPLGELNIAFYRDDFSRVGLHPRVRPSNLPFEIDNHHVILVDDVLYTGRTVRAAMNELFDYGRPARIILAVLIDRSGRELPVQADITGIKFALKEGAHVKLSGPEPLALVVEDRE